MIIDKGKVGRINILGFCLTLCGNKVGRRS